MDYRNLSSADGKNRGVDLAFNRAAVFSAEECNALIAWAEGRRIAELARIEDHQPSAGAAAFTRRNRQMLVSNAAHDRAVSVFRRKLFRWISALNQQIWRFELTDFSEMSIVRYEAGDEVGLHMDLDMEFCDRKLAALVQLSPAGDYEGGTLGFGLPQVAASREQGSLLVFPAWAPHCVAPLSAGVRHTAVCIALGPSFR